MFRVRYESSRTLMISTDTAVAYCIRLVVNITLIFFKQSFIKALRSPSTSSANTCRRCAANVYIVIDS
jgi:hypothetical protein